MKLTDITIRHVKAYLQAKSRKLLGASTHIEEQYSHRIDLVSKESPECISSKQCKICSCETPDLFLSDDPCEGGCYPRMMDKEAWEKYKKANNVNK
jgi:hypothetical protein